jgi:hypothetical protein
VKFLIVSTPLTRATINSSHIVAIRPTANGGCTIDCVNGKSYESDKPVENVIKALGTLYPPRDDGELDSDESDTNAL